MSHADDDHGLGHVMSVKMLVGVWAALMFFTAVTVVSAQFNLGALDLPIAMGIATFKAMLVALFFMHLKYDRPFNGLVFMASLIFAGLFVTFSMMDVSANQPDIRARQAAQSVLPSGG
jgi:cytochrome c oxidase subunit 4